MTAAHHEVPTHLNVEDKVLFGLTARQFLYMLVGSSAGYALWDQTGWLGDPVRVASVVISLGTALAFALVRPADRALEEWLVAALVYACAARTATWQRREPRAEDWRALGISWQELTPSLVWAEDDGA